MARKPSLLAPTRIPLEFDGIQVNFCKNPKCRNYGVPASQTTSRGRSPKNKDTYRVTGTSKWAPAMKCQFCGEYPTLKNNRAISEEVHRMLSGVEPPSEICCPDSTCTNHGIPVSKGAAYYGSHGTTRAGSLRYRCKACASFFSVAVKAGLRQRQEDKNEMTFKVLVHKMPLNCICECVGIHPETLYRRIDFFHDQCRAFSRAQELKLLTQEVKLDESFIHVDRQDYMVNWTARDDRRNVQLHGIGSSDRRTGYVFGLHLDFDHTVDAQAVEADADQIQDTNYQLPFRRYSRLWLKADHDEAEKKSYRRRLTAKPQTKINIRPGVLADVHAKYAQTEERDDVEVCDELDEDLRLPSKGMQVHSEYTIYGHFFFLEKLLRGTKAIRFFMDQESSIRAACLSAFKNRIKAGEVEAFFVRINKDKTIDQRRAAKVKANQAFEQAAQRFPNLSSKDAQIQLILEAMGKMSPVGKWNDLWLEHPFPNMSEPEKSVCCLTDLGTLPREEMAALYQQASLHAIDRFFMQMRRRVSLFERGIETASSKRIWHGYSPYKPERVSQVLEIYRVYYNYVKVGHDKKTPAMRLGLTDKPATVDQILRFMPSNALSLAA